MWGRGCIGGLVCHTSNTAMLPLPRSLILALTLLLAASPAVVACGAETEEEEADFTEDELATRLSVESIRSARTFNAMSIEGGGFGQAGRLMKFLVDARNPNAKKAHFISKRSSGNGRTSRGCRSPSSRRMSPGTTTCARR